MTDLRWLLVRTLGTRVAVLPLQIVATGLTAYLTIRTVGAEAYATVGLLVGLQALFGFISLGSSASVANAAGESVAAGDVRLFGVLVTATRVTLGAGGGLLITALVLAEFGLWPVLLGLGAPGLLTAGAIVAILGIALLQPLLQGFTVLMATGHTVAAVSSTAAGSVVTLGLVAVAAMLHLHAIVFVACPYLGQVVVAGVTAVVAARFVGVSVRELLLAVADRRVKGAKIRTEARPALAIWVMLPIAYQTDRLMISHLSSAEQLASYNVAVQVFNAAVGIVGTGASAMWGFFAKARQTRDLPTSSEFVRLSAGFGLLGLTLAIGYAVTMPWLASIISSGSIGVSWELALGFGALLISQSFHYPSAMLQTDVNGLRFNAYAVGAMTITNVALGVFLTPFLGAVGPVLASVVALTIALALPSFLRARKILPRHGECAPPVHPGRSQRTLHTVKP